MALTQAERDELELLELEAAEETYQLNKAKFEQYSQPDPSVINTGNYLKDIGGNAPQSFKTNVLNPLMNPIETISGVGKLVAGSAQQLGDLVSKDSLVPEGYDYRQYPTNLKDIYAKNYGSLGSFDEYLRTDPYAPIGDLLGLVSMGASLPGKAGKVGRAANMVDPLNLAVDAVRTGAKGASKLVSNNKARDMLKSVGKFSTVLDKNSPLGDVEMQRNKIANTMLENEIPFSYEGAVRAGNIYNDKLGMLKDIIANADAAGTKLDLSPSLANAQKIIDRYGKQSPMEASKGIDLVDDFLEPKKNTTYTSEVVGQRPQTVNEMLSGMPGADITRQVPTTTINTRLTPSEMQEAKVFQQKQSNYNTPITGSPRIDNDVRKSMASGMREQLETLDPNVKTLNEAMGSLRQMEQPFKRATARINNRDAIGLGVPMKVTAGEALGGKIGAGIAALQGVYESPKVKGNLAQRLYNVQNKPLNYSTRDRSGAWRTKLIDIGNELTEEERRKLEYNSLLEMLR